jgi:hypothetical protein
MDFGFAGCRETLPHLQRIAVYTLEAFEELGRLVLKPKRKARAAKGVGRRTTPRRAGAKAGGTDVNSPAVDMCALRAARAAAPARGQREYSAPTSGRLRPNDHSLPPPSSKRTEDQPPLTGGANPAPDGSDILRP